MLKNIKTLSVIIISLMMNDAYSESNLDEILVSPGQKNTSIFNSLRSVEVITSDNQSPNQAWLKIVQTTKAKTHIKRYIKMEEEEFFEEFGFEKPNPEMDCVFVCKAGVRSRLAQQHARERYEFKSALNYLGGADEWFSFEEAQ